MPAHLRRRQLLDTATRVFAETGFHQTTMHHIAEAAGVTKPVLYQHFASKRDLYLAVLEDVGDRLRASVLGAAGTADSPRGQVEAGLGAFVAFVVEDRWGFRLLFSGGNRLDAEFAEVFARVERSMADGIAELIQVEGMADEHRQVLAHGVVGLAEGMARHWLTGASTLRPEELVQDLAALVWAGLRGLTAIPPPPGAAGAGGARMGP
jgi:AcrR family transcriptional regulator